MIIAIRGSEDLILASPKISLPEPYCTCTGQRKSFSIFLCSSKCHYSQKTSPEFYVAETSSDDKRAFNIAVVATGPTLSILLARILSGVVANYTS